MAKSADRPQPKFENIHFIRTMACCPARHRYILIEFHWYEEAKVLGIQWFPVEGFQFSVGDHWVRRQHEGRPIQRLLSPRSSDLLAEGWNYQSQLSDLVDTTIIYHDPHGEFGSDIYAVAVSGGGYELLRCTWDEAQDAEKVRELVQGRLRESRWSYEFDQRTVEFGMKHKHLPVWFDHGPDRNVVTPEPEHWPVTDA